MPNGPGFHSMVFLVPKKDGGQKPVIKFEGTEHFRHLKMEEIRALRVLLN